MENIDKINLITEKIIASAIKVHKNLGPGLLESTYEACLEYELKRLNLKVERQKIVPVIYEDIKIECGYRVDLLVENKVIIELKAVENVLPVHKAQLISYLKLAKVKIGLLINFNVKKLVDGINRVMVNSL